MSRSSSRLPDPPPMPLRVRSLIGMRFGRLVVKQYAGADKTGHSYWCCECDCGNFSRVDGGNLLGTRDSKKSVKSCGCLRADPGIRRAARAKVPAKKRAAICDKMRAAVKHRKPAYAMDIHMAAEVLGVSVERINVLVADHTLRSTIRKGQVWVSSKDVASMLSLTQRKKAKCPMAVAKETAKGNS